MNARRAACAAIAGFLFAASAHAADGATGTAADSLPAPAHAPAPKPVPALQVVRGEHVNIEGKLYSPQALYILTRRDETFARDAIVPRYLDAPAGGAFLPTRLRAVPVPGTAPRP